MNDILEEFNERAAIREYDGGVTRKTAERLAAEELGFKVEDIEAMMRLSASKSRNP